MEAPSWKGPYKVVGSDLIDHCEYCEEDPVGLTASQQQHCKERHYFGQESLPYLAVLPCTTVTNSSTARKGTALGNTACLTVRFHQFMWVDHRNNWHVLYHRMFDGETTTKGRLPCLKQCLPCLTQCLSLRCCL